MFRNIFKKFWTGVPPSPKIREVEQKNVEPTTQQQQNPQNPGRVQQDTGPQDTNDKEKKGDNSKRKLKIEFDL